MMSQTLGLSERVGWLTYNVSSRMKFMKTDLLSGTVMNPS